MYSPEGQDRHWPRRQGWWLAAARGRRRGLASASQVQECWATYESWGSKADGEGGIHGKTDRWLAPSSLHGGARGPKAPHASDRRRAGFGGGHQRMEGECGGRGRKEMPHHRKEMPWLMNLPNHACGGMFAGGKADGRTKKIAPKVVHTLVFLVVYIIYICSRRCVRKNFYNFS